MNMSFGCLVISYGSRDNMAIILITNINVDGFIFLIAISVHNSHVYVRI